MANKTLPLLDAAAAVSDSDLLITRQGADTADTKQTAEAIKDYVIADLAAVATSGAYSDLSGAPTKVSEFSNDVGYLAESDLASARIFVGNASNVAVSRALSGDATLSNTGVLTVNAASATVAGKVELAIASEIDTGTDATRAMPVDQFVASKRNVRYMTYRVLDSLTDATDSVNAIGGAVRSQVAGTIIGVGAYNDTAGVTGTATYDIHLNGTTIMTTDKISIETGELSSRDATTQPTLTTTAIAIDGLLEFFIDTDQTTIAKGLTFWMAIRES